MDELEPVDLWGIESGFCAGQVMGVEVEVMVALFGLVEFV